jgi:ATP-dependent Clp protease adaptor protein ClpS
VYLIVVAVLAVAVFVGALFARRLLSGNSLLTTYFAPKHGRRLGIVEQSNVDGRRRLLLIRRDDVEHLVMIGGLATTALRHAGIRGCTVAPRLKRVHGILQSMTKTTNAAGLPIRMMAGKNGPGRDRGGDDGRTGLAAKTRPKTKKPSLYEVLLLNDDYTPMEFVVHVLEKYFSKGREEATRIMLQVHQKGAGICGVYSYEVAETKVTQVMDFSRQNGHPLQCTMEKE